MLDALKKEILPHAKECCEAHWDVVFDVMKKLVFEYSDCYDKGLLYIKGLEFKIDSPYYQQFMRMIVEGCGRKRMESLMVSQFYTNKISGLDAYLYYIYASTAIFLKEIINPRVYVLFLISMVPTASSHYAEMNDIWKYWDDESFFEKIKEFKEQGNFETAFEFEFCEDVFSKIIMQLSEHNIRVLVMFNNPFDVARALKCSTPKAINKILSCCNDRTCEHVLDILQNSDISRCGSGLGKSAILSKLTHADVQSVKIENEK